MKNVLSAALVCACFSLFSTGCTVAPPKNPDVPADLKVEANEALVFTAFAEGVQIYSCDSIAPNQYQWKLNRPEATLSDEKGNKIGTHGKGPFWESNMSATDKGSKVIGDKATLKDYPSPDTTAIPRVKLKSKEHTGEGIFGKISTIQRVKTEGGKAPKTIFDKTYAGKELRVPYKATYYFYTKF